jgi:hypothetical protein
VNDENEVLYPPGEDELVEYSENSVPRLVIGTCGAGREGVREVAVTW